MENATVTRERQRACTSTVHPMNAMNAKQYMTRPLAATMGASMPTLCMACTSCCCGLAVPCAYENKPSASFIACARPALLLVLLRPVNSAPPRKDTSQYVACAIRATHVVRNGGAGWCTMKRRFQQQVHSNEVKLLHVLSVPRAPASIGVLLLCLCRQGRAPRVAA